MSKKVGIYKVESENGAIYIGQSIDVDSRISGYKRKNCKNQILLYNSLCKYGVDSHSFEIVEVINTDGLSSIDIKNILNKLETKYINSFKSFIRDNPKGLNLTKGGDSKEVSDETKSKISKTLTGKKRDKKTKKKLSIAKKGKNNPNYGKKATNETRKKQSESRSGEKHYMFGKKTPDDVKEKIRQSNLGKKRTKEARENMSKAAKGKVISPETKIKLSLAGKGRVVSEETKLKLIAFNTGRKASDETRKKQSEIKLGKKLSPESIAKREATKKRNRELIEEEKRMMIF